METKQIDTLLNELRNNKNGIQACQNEAEFHNMASWIEKCNDLSGHFAEIGAYEGFTSEFIFKLKDPKKNLFLCDTFTGLADVCEEDSALGINNGGLAVSYDRFCSMNPYVSDSSVIVVQGYFPDSATAKMNKSKFCFVHIDTDTYNSTKNSLEYFYNKMVSGGVIVLHDYDAHQGMKAVKKAVDEFMMDKEESVSIKPGCTQAIIVKI